MRHSNSMNDLNNPQNYNNASHIKMSAGPRNNFRQTHNSGGSSFQFNNNPSQQLRQVGIAQNPKISSDRPYMMFVYSQKFQVQGQGEYEIKITNVINPYTMKATPLQPSLIDPSFMMSKGIGNSKKALGITQQEIPHIIMQQNNIQESRYSATQQTERQNFNGRGRAQRFGDGFPTHGMKSGANTNRQLHVNQTPNRGGVFGKAKFSGGAGVRMLACSHYYKKTVQSNQDKKQNDYQKMPAVEQYSLEEKIQRRQQIAASLMKKWVNNQIRKEFQVIKKDSWSFFKFREQQKMKRSVQLIKLIGLIQDKMKSQKFQSFGKLKEHQLSIIHEKSNALDSQTSSQGNSKNVSCIKNTLNPQDNYTSQQPTTAGQSFVQQQQPPKISQAKQKAMKVIAYHLDQILLDHKLAFWLPFRAEYQKTNAYIQELKIDFSQQQFDRSQLEKELAQRFNKIEIKKIESGLQNNQENSSKSNKGQRIPTQSRNQNLFNMNETLDFTDPIKAMEMNLGNISAIQPFQLQHLSRNEDTFIQELHYLNTNRSRLSKLSIDNQSKRRFNDSQDFSPLFKNEDPLFLSSPGENRINTNMDSSSILVTEDDVKAIKIENNLHNINKDIKKVNDEIEQIKRLLFNQNQTPMNPQGNNNQQNDSWLEDSVVSDFDIPPIETGPNVNSKKRQLVPVSKINKNFRTEEEMIEYYELKALDHDDVQQSHQIQLPLANKLQNTNQFSSNNMNLNFNKIQNLYEENQQRDFKNFSYEEFKGEIGHLKIGDSGIKKHQSTNQRFNKPRDRSDSLKKNIKKYEQSRFKNLNDSRENDFDGFEDYDDEIEGGIKIDQEYDDME